MVSQKENDNFLVTESQNTGYCNLIYNSKLAIMMNFSKLQENLWRQYNDLRNKINEYKEYFTKEVEILEKN